MAKKKSSSVEPQAKLRSVISPASPGGPQVLRKSLIVPAAGVFVLFPEFGGAVVVVELMLVVAIVLTALWGPGPEPATERAFRILGMLLNRPEPPVQQ
ncbi:hypothetical protein [Streptomyces sp. 8N706]|uniref:hypothetical protein n=1 Tax=Streptomyces sp. 8N706 TaxID=3457416 RepID=UPI003FD4D002